MSYINHDDDYYNRAYIYANTFMEPDASSPNIIHRNPPGSINENYGPVFTCCDHCKEHKPLPPIERNPKGSSYYKNPPCIPSRDENNNEPNRDHVIVNIETRIKKILSLTLYSFDEEDDIKIDIEEGKQYKIVYISNNGNCLEVLGYLRYIDTNIPAECIRYIGENENITYSAHIIMDCSKVGDSDIRKIFIASIRYIEEIEETPTNNDQPQDNNQTSNE